MHLQTIRHAFEQAKIEVGELLQDKTRGNKRKQETRRDETRRKTRHGKARREMRLDKTMLKNPNISAEPIDKTRQDRKGRGTRQDETRFGKGGKMSA